MNPVESLRFFLPEIFLTSGAFLALALGFWVKNKKTVGVLSLLIVFGTILLSRNPAETQFLFFGFFTLDPLTHFFRLLALSSVAVAILLSLVYKPLPQNDAGEYYSLLLFFSLALILMGAATNLLQIYLSVEFVSLTSYLLVGFLKKDPKAKEAAIKYLLFGSVCSAVMLYGMSLIFGATGSLDFAIIQKGVFVTAFTPVLFLSLFLFLTGLGFKISMVPFHLWAPDVYEAAPTPVTALLTIAPKALGFALIIRVLSIVFIPISLKWKAVIVLLSILTMTLGNLTAIAQTNIKRLLAYSSIGQAGYILMGLAAFSTTGKTGILIYLVAYALTNLGAFAAVVVVSNHTGSDDIHSYAGLGKRSPLLAASMVVFLLSLAGIPPLAGFMAKFFVFLAAIEAKLITLVVVAAVNSAVAAYYYFKIIRAMYLEPSASDEAIPYPASAAWVTGLLLAGVLFVGIYPSPLIHLLQGIIP